MGIGYFPTVERRPAKGKVACPHFLSTVRACQGSRARTRAPADEPGETETRHVTRCMLPLRSFLAQSPDRHRPFGEGAPPHYQRVRTTSEARSFSSRVSNSAPCASAVATMIRSAGSPWRVLNCAANTATAGVSGNNSISSDSKESSIQVTGSRSSSMRPRADSIESSQQLIAETASGAFRRRAERPSLPSFVGSLTAHIHAWVSRTITFPRPNSRRETQQCHLARERFHAETLGSAVPEERLSPQGVPASSPPRTHRSPPPGQEWRDTET